MNKVYVVHNAHRFDSSKGILVPKHDVTSAEKFGELIFVLPPSCDPHDKIQEKVREIEHRLSAYNDNDYLLLIGNPVLIGLATAIAASLNKGMIKVLQWNGKAKEYRPIEIVLDCLR